MQLILIKRSQNFLKKSMIPSLGQEMYKKNLEYLDIPDSKEAINRTQEPTGRGYHWSMTGQYKLC